MPGTLAKDVTRQCSKLRPFSVQPPQSSRRLFETDPEIRCASSVRPGRSVTRRGVFAFFVFAGKLGSKEAQICAKNEAQKVSVEKKTQNKALRQVTVGQGLMEHRCKQSKSNSKNKKAQPLSGELRWHVRREPACKSA